jgi:hypothetical protein
MARRKANELSIGWLGWLTAQVQDAHLHDVKQGYSGLIFTGCFFLALILIGIWWLNRNA